MVRIDTEIFTNAKVEDVLKYVVGKHDGRWHETLGDYYEGKHAILSRKMNDETKPNNRLVHGLPAYIVDTMTGYFMGKPVSYTGDDDYMEALKGILDSNNEQDHNSEIAKAQSIRGAAYELLYTDAEADVKFVDIPRERMIYVESADVEAVPLMAVRTYKVEELDGKETEYYDVYTDSEVLTYVKKEDKDGIRYMQVDGFSHYFGEVPVVQYKNNKELLGDFEGVISLIDAYNVAQSDTANDFEYFTDAYMIMTGAALDPDDVQQMKENRTILMPDKECSVNWLVKNQPYLASREYKERIRQDIHTLSKVPDLTADEFGTALSGVAIAYRMMNLEQVCATKERKFKKGLQRRIKLITNILNTQGKQWDWRDIEIQFSRNLPQNLKEIAEIVGMLAGRIDDETLISLLPFVEDPADILEKLREQKEEAIDLTQYMDDEEEEEKEVGEVEV